MKEEIIARIKALEAEANQYLNNHIAVSGALAMAKEVLETILQKEALSTPILADALKVAEDLETPAAPAA